MSEHFSDDRRQASVSLGRFLLEVALEHGPRSSSTEEQAEPGKQDEALESALVCESCRGASCPAHAEPSAPAGEGHIGTRGGWMPRRRRAFPGTPDQVAEVRRFVRLVADGHEAVCLAELVACELSANAVLHTRSGDPGGWFTLEVRFGAGGVLIAVSDPGSEEDPAADPADGLDVSGRGLWLVELLSLAWGSERTETGRRIWAVLPASGTRPPDP